MLHGIYILRMRTLRLLGALVAITLPASLGAFAQGRTVAITIDDLPYAGENLSGRDLRQQESTAKRINGQLRKAFRAHRVPVTGFVIQKRVDAFGATGTSILKAWVGEGFDLGNHTYSHPDINSLSVEQIEEDIVRGESGFGPLMSESGKRSWFFRFPMNHTGDTPAKHDAIAAFLLTRGYRLATCTIDTSDYIFNQAYLRMLAQRDATAMQRLRSDYLAYTKVEIDYYASLNKQVFGYEPPEVMLLHDNRLNADMIGQVLAVFEEKRYRFVTLEAAESDSAYQTPDSYITKFGPMWGYRWAKERNIKVNDRLETDPPQWVLDYPKPAQQ